MNLTLSRKHIFLSGIVIILLFITINRISMMAGSATAAGKVVSIKTGSYQRSYVYNGGYHSAGSYSAPVIQFETDNSTITFTGERNVELEYGAPVTVIYKKANPTDAWVYSFSGFWMAPLIYGLIPLLVLAAAVYSFLSKKDRLQIAIGKTMKVGLTSTAQPEPAHCINQIPHKH